MIPLRLKGYGTPARDALAALTWLSALALLSYGACILGQRTIVLRDLFTQFQGPRWWYQQSLQAGQIPYWNPFIGCGVPFLANPQNSVFYPLTPIFAVLPFGSALALYAALHQLLLGFFSYLLGRSLGLSFWGALLAGTIAGFAGIPVKQIEFPEMLGGFAWTPLVLLGAWKCLADPRPRWSAVVGAAFGLQLLAGSPYPPLYSILGIVAAVAAAVIGKRGQAAMFGMQADSKHRGLTPSIAYLGLGLALGALLGCAQYIPTLMLVRGLPPNELASVMQTRFSLRLRDLADFLGPRLAGFPNWQKCFYVGLTALVFALFGLRRTDPAAVEAPPRLARTAWWFAVLLVLLGLVFAQGNYLGTDRIIDALPLVRRAGKWPTLVLSLSVIGLGLLAGAGLERWTGSARPRRWWIWPAATGLFATALFMDVARQGPWLHAAERGLSEPMLVFRSPSLFTSFPRDLGAEAGLAITAAVLAVLLWAGFSGLFRRALGAAVCLLAAGELLSDGWDLNFRSPVDLYTEKAPADTARFLGEHYDQGRSRILVPKLFNGFGDITYGSEVPDDFRTLRGLFDLDTVMSWRVFTTQGSGSVQLPDYQFRLQPLLDGLAANGSAEAYRILGAWNVAVMLKGGIDTTGLHAEFVRNPYVLPRARLVERNVNVPTADDALTAIARGQWDQATVLTAWDQHLPEYSAGAGEPGEVTGIDYTPEGVRIACAAARPCFLVLAENWAQGWSVTVDGWPAHLVRANYLQQAVRLGPGRHEVTFRYVAPGSGAGLLLAALGLAGIGCCAGISRKK